MAVETEQERNSDVARLVQEAASGQADSWTELVSRFSPMIQSIARSHRLSAADTADVVQTTWVKFVEHIHRIEQPERVGGWLATTARRESLRLIRVGGREVLSDDSDFSTEVAPGPELDVRLLTEERDAVIRTAFKELPTRGQTILGLLMRDAALSYRELSAQLGMPIGSIGPTRQRYLETLRKLIASHEPDLATLQIA